MVLHNTRLPFYKMHTFRFLSFTAWAAIQGTLLAAPFPPAPTAHKQLAAGLFHVPDGLEVTAWAHSPLFYNPTNMDADAHGRIWIAEGVNYRGKVGTTPGDRIMVIADADGDGRAEHSHVFVQEPALVAPLGLAVFDNVVVVSQPPEMLVYTDVNRNAIFEPGIDKREVLLTGFNGKNHDHSLHSVTGGPDGFWYWNQGNTGAQFKDGDGREFSIGSPYNGGGGTFFTDPTKYAGKTSGDGQVWVSGFAARMQPDARRLQIIGHGFRNSYEQTLTSFGDIFQNDNDDPPACRVTHLLEGGFLGFCSPDGQRSWAADQRPGQDTPTAEWRQEDPHTIPAGDIYGGGAPTGIAYYENGILGDAWSGLLLSCETGRNTVYGYKPVRSGAGFKLERFDFLTTNKTGTFSGTDFVIYGKDVQPISKEANKDAITNFRPSDVCVGADGAIYVADWYDPRTGGHATQDASFSGTIYRIAPKGHIVGKTPPPDLTTTAGQITALSSPAVNVRWTGWKALQTAGEKSLMAVKNLLAHPQPSIAARALWLLPHLGPDGVEAVRRTLLSPQPQLRLTAMRALRLAESPAWLEAITPLAADPEPSIRAELAIALRHIPWERAASALTTVATLYDGKDASYLAALGLGSYQKNASVYAALASNAGAPSKWSPAMARQAWKLMAPEAVPALLERALDSSLDESSRKLAIDSIAFIEAKPAAAAMLHIFTQLPPADPLRPAVQWWLENRQDNLWLSFDLRSMASALQIKSLSLVADPIEMPVPAPTPEQAAQHDKAAILALTGDPVKGATVAARCMMCHQTGKGGAQYGPGLLGWGRTQPPDVICEAIIDPSKTIAHGYEGIELLTHSGKTIHGILTENSQVVRVRSMGGLTQRLTRSEVKSQSPLGRSLMLSAAQLGLTAQEVADVIAYLRAGAR